MFQLITHVLWDTYLMCVCDILIICKLFLWQEFNFFKIFYIDSIQVYLVWRHNLFSLLTVQPVLSVVVQSLCSSVPRSGEVVRCSIGCLVTCNES